MQLITAHVIGVAGKRIVRDEVTGRSIKNFYQNGRGRLRRQALIVGDRHLDLENAGRTGCVPGDAAAGAGDIAAVGCPDVGQRIAVGIAGVGREQHSAIRGDVERTFLNSSQLRRQVDFCQRLHADGGGVALATFVGDDEGDLVSARYGRRYPLYFRTRAQDRTVAGTPGPGEVVGILVEGFGKDRNRIAKFDQCWRGQALDARRKCIGLCGLAVIHHRAVDQHFIALVADSAARGRQRDQQGCVGRNIQVDGTGNALLQKGFGDGIVHVHRYRAHFEFHGLDLRVGIEKQGGGESRFPVKIRF